MGMFSKAWGAVATTVTTKMITMATVVAVLVGGMVGLTYDAPFSSAEAAVAMAAKKTFVGQSDSLEEVFGIGELTLAMQQKGAEILADVVIPEISLENLGLPGKYLADVDLQLVTKITAQKEIGAVLDVSAANKILLTGNVYVNDTQLQLTVPKLSKSVFTLNHKDQELESKLKNSYAVTYLGLTEEQIKTFTEYLPKQTALISTKEVQKKLWEILTEAYNRNLSDTEITKAGEETFYKMGREQHYKIYAAEMNATEVGAFLEDALSMIKEYGKEVCTNFRMTEQEVETAFAESSALVSKIKENLRNSVFVKIYVCDGRIIKATADWSMKIRPQNGKLTEPGSLAVDFATQGNPLENMSIVLHTPVHQDAAASADIPERLDITCQITTANASSVYNVNYRVDYNGTPMKLAFEYSKQDGGFTLAASTGQQSYTVTGVVSQINKGSSLELILNTFKHTEGNQSEVKELNATVSVKVWSGTVAPLTGTKRQDVLTMKESDFTALEKEITKNVTKLLFSIMGLIK